MKVEVYTTGYRDKVADLVLSIQREEFALDLTAADQPDLAIIDSFYQSENGNFWIATLDQQVIGTIALIDIGNQEVALRKMFVHPLHRGKEKGVAQALMQTAIDWGRSRQVTAIYLGTIDIMKAAHRFYEKNGFVRIERAQLPTGFMQMNVDNVFYKLMLPS